MVGAARPNREPLSVGSVIRERWRVERYIGHGASSLVFAASHRNGDRVAIKVLKLELAQEPELRARFLREAYVANQIGHPGVIRVIDDDVTPDGCPLLVMDLLEGETLDERRKSAGGRLPLEEVVNYTVELLDILEAAHDKGFAHRDIKPANIFIDANGRVRVLDFGLARIMAGAAEFVTQAGMIMGTPQYMSPEQADGRVDEVDARSDLWSVGASVFMLVSGQPVHSASGLHEMLEAIAKNPARSLAEVAPEVPKQVVRVIDRALAHDRDARWRTAGAMRDALLAAMEVQLEDPTVAVVAPRPARDDDDTVATDKLPSVAGNVDGAERSGAPEAIGGFGGREPPNAAEDGPTEKQVARGAGNKRGPNRTFRLPPTRPATARMPVMPLTPPASPPVQNTMPMAPPPPASPQVDPVVLGVSLGVAAVLLTIVAIVLGMR